MATVLLVNTIETIVQGGVVINVFNLPGSSQTTQAAGTFESTSIVPIASEQGQVAGVEGSLPQQIQENQQDHTTELDYWNLILSLGRPLQTFCQYLKNMLNVIVRRHDTGSLLLTVECRSLQILEGLWKDYCSEHLNKMAQESLITAEVLEKLGLTEIKLKVFISEEEYERGKQIFRETKEMKRTHSEAFGQESSMPSTSGSESQFINAVFFSEKNYLGCMCPPPAP